MKPMKILIPMMLCLVLVAVDVQARISTNVGWRWRNDDGTEETATWATDEEMQEGTLVGTEEIVRLRTEHTAPFDCAELKVKAAGSELFVSYADYFAFADSLYLAPGDPVQRRLRIPFKPFSPSEEWPYSPGGHIVESPCLIPASPEGTYQELELCLKAREGASVPEGGYTFMLPNGYRTQVPLVYKYARAATVTTLAPTEITATTSTGAGEVSDLGLRHPVKHGLCWATTEDPDITCPKTGGGEVTETGPFAHPITGLAPGTTYYVRAFATNSAGTVYGEQVSFTTRDLPDTEEPRVVSCNIAENAWEIPLNITPRVVFSEPMDPASLTTASLVLTVGGVRVATDPVYTEASRTLTLLPKVPLPADGQATLTVTPDACDRTGNGLYEAFRCHFTTANPGPDQDSDGVPDSEEAFPGDSSRATVAAVTNTGHFTLNTSALGDGIELSGVRTLSEYDPSLGRPGKPADATFPDGILAYSVEHVEKGGTVDLPVGVPSGLGGNTRVYKVTAAGYVDITGRCRMEGDTLFVTLVDGGPGDGDGRADGTIVDPLAVAVFTDTETGDTDEGGPCFVRSAAWR